MKLSIVKIYTCTAICQVHAVWNSSGLINSFKGQQYKIMQSWNWLYAPHMKQWSLHFTSYCRKEWQGTILLVCKKVQKCTIY